jgi:hypothetical protein
MRCRKAVTKKKLEANRNNSKRSTGPRTQQGKITAKFNAVALGLCARHVVIDICDGDDARAEFQSLLNGLHKQFEPVGIFEEWLVSQIAECMWRLRRATRCENRLVVESVLEPSLSPFCSWQDDDKRASRLADEVGLLNYAASQIRETGTLSPGTYRELQPLLAEQPAAGNTDTVTDSKTAEINATDPNIDKNILLSKIADRKEFLEPLADSNAQLTVENVCLITSVAATLTHHHQTPKSARPCGFLAHRPRRIRDVELMRYPRPRHA